MRWGMHKWFLAGMLASGVITVLLVLMAQSVAVSAVVVIAYLIVSAGLLHVYFRRRAGRSFGFRSRELRCKWPRDVSLRQRRTAEPVPRRAAMLLAID